MPSHHQRGGWAFCCSLNSFWLKPVLESCLFSVCAGGVNIASLVGRTLPSAILGLVLGLIPSSYSVIPGPLVNSAHKLLTFSQETGLNQWSD